MAAYADLPSSPTPTPRCRPSASTWRSRPAAPAPTSCTRTPGTPTSAGHLAGLLYGVPHVVTAHSLEPMRPWKAEQLGGGYALSSWAERTSYLGASAVIAVSAAMRDDVLHAYPDINPAKVHVVHNGIDTDGWSPRRRPRPGALAGRRPGPAVGRLRRPDHPAEGAAAVPARRRRSCRPTSSWCSAPARPTPRRSRPRSRGWSPSWPPSRARRRLDPRDAPAPRRGRAAVARRPSFVCPSIYEPLGIVNLEAMACETAVVATATGGIPEVVVHGETGLAGADRAGQRRHRHPAGSRTATSPTSPRR